MFDLIYNRIFINYILNLSYFVFYKKIEKNFLEYFNLIFKYILYYINVFYNFIYNGSI